MVIFDMYFDNSVSPNFRALIHWNWLMLSVICDRCFQNSLGHSFLAFANLYRYVLDLIWISFWNSIWPMVYSRSAFVHIFTIKIDLICRQWFFCISSAIHFWDYKGLAQLKHQPARTYPSGQFGWECRTSTQSLGVHDNWDDVIFRFGSYCLFFVVFPAWNSTNVSFLGSLLTTLLCFLFARFWVHFAIGCPVFICGWKTGSISWICRWPVGRLHRDDTYIHRRPGLSIMFDSFAVILNVLSSVSSFWAGCCTCPRSISVWIIPLLRRPSRCQGKSRRSFCRGKQYTWLRSCCSRGFMRAGSRFLPAYVGVCWWL